MRQVNVQPLHAEVLSGVDGELEVNEHHVVMHSTCWPSLLITWWTITWQMRQCWQCQPGSPDTALAGTTTTAFRAHVAYKQHGASASLNNSGTLSQHTVAATGCPRSPCTHAAVAAGSFSPAWVAAHLLVDRQPVKIKSFAAKPCVWRLLLEVL
jgi:hypothetical protein